MEVMILAAGRGKRLRPLTDYIPKPLIKIGQQALIEYHLEKLSNYDVTQVVINVSYLSEKIIDYIENGRKYGLKISYSKEPEGALGTAGGIVNALSLFNEDQFIVLNSDIFTDFDFMNLQLSAESNAHLVLVPNPNHNMKGDYNLVDGVLQHRNNYTLFDLTFAGIGMYRKKFFERLPPKTHGLAHALELTISEGKVSGEVHPGLWIDVGNSERLIQARAQVSRVL